MRRGGIVDFTESRSKLPYRTAAESTTITPQQHSEPTMSYDYSSASDRLNVPNPLKIENIFLLLLGTVFVVAAIMLLLMLRSQAGLGAGKGLVGALAMCVILLTIGIAMFWRALNQLRFYFGRGRPANLYAAPDLPVGVIGTSEGAQAMQETLRHQGLAYPEPTGAINPLLYSLLPDLIYSAPPIRAIAQLNFRNALVMVAMVACLILALTGGKVGLTEDKWARVSDYIGLLFLVGAVWMLAKPVIAGGGSKLTPVETNLGMKHVIGLILFAGVGPILLAFAADKLPALTWFTPYPHVYIVFGLGLLAYALFFVALLRQLRKPPQTLVTTVQEPWNINCSPKQILDEFARDMQERWPEKIPNRRYVQQDPNVDLSKQSGEFRCEMLEETQPLPVKNDPLSLGSVVADSRFQMVFLLDVMGAVSLLLAAMAFFSCGRIALGASEGEFAKLLAYGLLFGALGSYLLWAAHWLWLRFDFSSRVIWLEMSGQYTSAKMDYGNVMSDTIKTSSSAVKIEAMTFRLWTANIESVMFGKDEQRHILSMTGDNDFSQAILLRLKSFAQNQASIFAPSAPGDAARHAQLAQMNQAVRGEGNAVTPQNVIAAVQRNEEK